MFLRHVDLGMNLQEAIDAPEFHTDHLISSFYPARLRAESLALESRFVADGRRSPAARPRRHALAGVVARPRDGGRARAGRPAQGGREPARHAGLRRRALASSSRDRAHAHLHLGRPVRASRREAGRSGLEVMQLMAAGEIPPPPIAQTLGFRLVEADAVTRSSSASRRSSTTTRSAPSTRASPRRCWTPRWAAHS